MPIHNFRQISRFSAACGAWIPDWLARLFDGVEPDTALHGMVAANVAVEQCRRLRAEGITAFHVYALNRAELPAALVRLLGVAASRRTSCLIGRHGRFSRLRARPPRSL